MLGLTSCHQLLHFVTQLKKNNISVAAFFKWVT